MKLQHKSRFSYVVLSQFHPSESFLYLKKFVIFNKLQKT
jgi:hypothetical protein